METKCMSEETTWGSVHVLGRTYGTAEDLELRSSYNTYVYTGLPPKEPYGQGRGQ